MTARAAKQEWRPGRNEDEMKAVISTGMRPRNIFRTDPHHRQEAHRSSRDDAADADGMCGGKDMNCFRAHEIAVAR